MEVLHDPHFFQREPQVSPRPKLRRKRRAPGAHGLTIWVTAFFLAFSCLAKDPPGDWQDLVRERVAARDFPGALRIVEIRLAAAPQDLEARVWRARLLAWTGRWQEAETEYREVLAAAPRDVDILLGLARTLSAQQRYEEALALLKAAQEIDPKRSDTYISEGNAYRSLSQTKLARMSYRQALLLSPRDPEALAGLASLSTESRYVLSFGVDVDTFNYTDSARAYTTTFAARINSRWSADVSGIAQQRFGQDAGRFLASVSHRLSRQDSITAGGGAARDQGIVPKGEAYFGFGHGFRGSTHGLVRGVETSYQQHWFWFRSASALALTPRVQFDFPREWAWAIQVTAARNLFSGLAPAWQPSGLTRLSFPLYRHLSGNAFFALGTENFALVDQVGRFSARTFGGGLRYRFPNGQELAGYGAWQKRSQGRTQTSYGVSYAIHF